MKIRSITAEASAQHEFSILKLIETFESIGLTLANPFSKVASGYSSEGDRVVLGEGLSLAALIQLSGAGLQMWFDDSTDIFISWQLNGSVLEAFVEALSPVQCESVAKAMLGELASQGIRGQFEVAFELTSEER